MDKKVIPFSPRNGNPGCMVGKEVKVTQYTQLKAIQFYITEYGKPASNYSYGILQFSDEDGFVNLLQEFNSETADIKGDIWIENKLNEPLLLQPGRYLIFMKWEALPGDRGTGAQTVGFIELENSHEISWMNWNGSINGWYKDTGSYQGEFLIEPVF